MQSITLRMLQVEVASQWLRILWNEDTSDKQDTFCCPNHTLLSTKSGHLTNLNISFRGVFRTHHSPFTGDWWECESHASHLPRGLLTGHVCRAVYITERAMGHGYTGIATFPPPPSTIQTPKLSLNLLFIQSVLTVQTVRAYSGMPPTSGPLKWGKKWHFSLPLSRYISIPALRRFY